MHAQARMPIRARWLLVAVWVLAIFGFSSLQGGALPAGAFDYAPYAHFLEYAVLGALMAFAFGPSRVTALAGLALLIACSLYGVSDEFHQSFVPGRTPDPVDWTVDTVGAGAGIAALSLAARRRART